MSETTGAKVTVSSHVAELRRHPIRGVLWGLMTGVGLTLVLVVAKVIDLDLTMMIVVTVIATLMGVIWSTVGPAKEPTGPPPATMTASAAPAPSRFDDFTDPADAGTAHEPDRPLAVPDAPGDDSVVESGDDTEPHGDDD